MLIITGTGRSGTGMLARVFGGTHEFRTEYLLAKYFRSPDGSKPALLLNLETRLRAVLDLHQGIHPDLFVDASNLYLYLVDALWALYPGVRFFLGTRNPREFIVSAMARGWHERTPEDLLIFRGDSEYREWNGLAPAEKMAVVWVRRNSVALDALKVLPSTSWSMGRIEALDAESVEALGRTLGHPAVDPAAVQKDINAGPHVVGSGTFIWSAKEDSMLARVAGRMMKRLGYEQT